MKNAKRNPGRKLDVERTATGYEPMDDATIKAALTQVRSLVVQNWTLIKKMAGDTEGNKASVGITLALNFSGNKPSTKTKIRWSVRHSDETETEHVEDPRQQHLPMDEQEAA